MLPLMAAFRGLPPFREKLCRRKRRHSLLPLIPGADPVRKREKLSVSGRFLFFSALSSPFFLDAKAHSGYNSVAFSPAAIS